MKKKLGILLLVLISIGSICSISFGYTNWTFFNQLQGLRTLTNNFSKGAIGFKNDLIAVGANLRIIDIEATGASGSKGDITSGSNIASSLSSSGSTGDSGSITSLATEAVTFFQGATGGIGSLLITGGSGGRTDRNIGISGYGSTGGKNLGLVSIQGNPVISDLSLGATGSSGTVTTYLTLPQVILLTATGATGGNTADILTAQSIEVFGLYKGSSGSYNAFASVSGGLGSQSSNINLDGYGSTGAKGTPTIVGTDVIPNSFTFTDETGIALSTAKVSNSITVAGITGPSPISVTGDTGYGYKKNGAACTSTSGTVVANDTVNACVTSSSSPTTATTSTVTIGGVSDTYSVTTNSGLGSFSDDFSTDTSANWTTLWGTIGYDSTDHNWYTSGSGGTSYYKTTTGSVTQYAKATFVQATNGIVLRSTGTASDGYYVANIYNNKLYLSRFNNTGWLNDIANANLTFAAGNTLSVTITGTGNSTTCRAWVNTTANSPSNATTWDGGAAGASVTVSASPYYDTGTYVGLGINAGSAHTDNFYGGGL